MPRIVAALLTITVAAGCVVPAPSGSGGRSSAPTTATPVPSGLIVDLERMIECRQVPEAMCLDYALSMVRGPQPDYAEGAGIERVIVTCERLPPCAPDRRDSGGNIIILYTNGWAWSQDWAVMAGV
jgi:hypothetical protein